MPSIADNVASGDPTIDGFLGSRRWDDDVVTFSFPQGPADYLTPDPEGWDAGAVEFSNALKLAARTAAAEVNDYVADLTLDEIVGNVEDATIKMAGSTAYGGVGGFSRGVGTADNQGEVWIGQNWLNIRGDELMGDLSWQVVFHELGHSLGLSHTDEGSGVDGSIVPVDRDSSEFTVMSYKGYVQPNPRIDAFSNERNEHAQSYMMLDIAALQHMYGADFETRSGDTTYSFSPTTGQMLINGVGQTTPADNIIFRTIWDGNGTDTYDFSLYGASRDLNIDLRPGMWSDMDRDSNFQAADLNRDSDTQGPDAFARGSVFNALLYQDDERSLIENAFGGAGDDSILGNQADNLITGGAGFDTLHGFAGNDTLRSGSGGGVLVGEEGNDSLEAGNGAESLFGGAGNDWVSYLGATGGGVSASLALGTGSLGWALGDSYNSIENLAGSNQGDILAGNDAGNGLLGHGGNDFISGGDGNDVLDGGAGNDTLQGGAAEDTLLGGSGTDTARFGSAVTLNLTTGIHSGEAAGDVFVSIERFEGSQSADILVGDAAGQVLAGRGGDDTLHGEGGADTLLGGAGNDSIDGGAGTDLLDYAAEAAGVQVNLGTSLAIGVSIEVDLLDDIENVYGTAHDDSLWGDGAANELRGLAGDDYIIGGAGADTLNGGSSDDTILGGVGDSVLGGAGTDVLRFGTTPVLVDLLTGVHDGGADGMTIATIERIEGSTGADILLAGNGKPMAFDGRGGADTLGGGSRSDSLFGGADADSINGNGGNDLIAGGVGADQLRGGSGADIFLWRAGDLGVDRIFDFVLGEDRVGFEGFVSSPVLGGQGGAEEFLRATTSFGMTALEAHTVEAGWQVIARLDGVSLRGLDAAIDDGSILAPTPAGGFDLF